MYGNCVCGVFMISGRSVFISYSHDSEEYKNLVLSFSQFLRAEGIFTILDQQVLKNSPPEGWPRWMMNSLNSAENVLCICTSNYRRRFLGLEEQGKGKGGDWEGALITQALYDARSNTNKFIPILFPGATYQDIPEPLRPLTHYFLESESDYKYVSRLILNVSKSKIDAGYPSSSKTCIPEFNKNTSTGSVVKIDSQNSYSALSIWMEKLEYMLVEDAICSDPAMKFRIKKLILEAEDKILILKNKGVFRD